MLPTLQGSAADAAVALQGNPALPEALGGPFGSLLVALVVVALIVFIGRYVMSVAWRLVKIAIVIVGLAWLVLTILPMLGL